MKGIIENAPALKIDAILYGHQPMPAQARLERRVVWNLLRHLASAGFAVASVESDESVDVASSESAMEQIFNLDDCWVTFRKGGKGPYRSVYLVLGNGLDVVSDWRYAPGDADRFNAAIERFDPDQFA
jgi:hypothetical protein